MSSFETRHQTSLAASAVTPSSVFPGYSIQATDSDEEALEKPTAEYLERSDNLTSQQDLWQTPAEVFVQTSSDFLERSKFLKRKIFKGDCSPKSHMHISSENGHINHRVRSSSDVEASSRRYLLENAGTPSWSSRSLLRHSRCSVTPRPEERNSSDSPKKFECRTCRCYLIGSLFTSVVNVGVCPVAVICCIETQNNDKTKLLLYSLRMITFL
ncbi:hypothetical protein Btru_063298 [Bulinus truncatus]|nr:hypothetical protein Btru_063298 [Bulinus truncatus]